MKTLLTTGCSLALLSGCTIPKVQEAVNGAISNPEIGAGVQTFLENAPMNPADITGWLYAAAAGALGIGGAYATKYLKKKPEAPENVQVK